MTLLDRHRGFELSTVELGFQFPCNSSTFEMKQSKLSFVTTQASSKSTSSALNATKTSENSSFSAKSSTTLPTAVPSTIYEALLSKFGHSQFRPGQEAVVKAVLERRDCLGVFPTGAGKVFEFEFQVGIFFDEIESFVLFWIQSLLYQLPATMLPGITIVVSPLIALMEDQVDFSSFLMANAESNTQRLRFPIAPIRFANSKRATSRPSSFIAVWMLHLAANRLPNSWRFDLF